MGIKIDTSYNFAVNMLLEWGQVFLQKEEFSEFLSETEKEIFSVENLESYLKDGVSYIVKEAEKAGNVLSDSAIINVTPDDDEWHETEAAFFMLDHVIYLTKAIENVIAEKNSELADMLLSELDDQLNLITDLLYNETFSPLRLVSFNEMRKSMLENITKEHHYLFPWYDLLSEEEPSVLEMLIAHYHKFSQSGLREELPETLKERLPFYLAEIQRDTELKKYIETENTLSVSLEKTFNAHWAFALLNEARLAGYKRLLPEDVETIGIEKVSRAILTQKFQTSADQLVMKIVEACFAPAIRQDKRVQILLESENKVKELDVKEIQDNLILKCAGQLKELDSGKIKADVVAETFLDFWFAQIKAAISVKEPLSDKIKSAWLMTNG